MLGLLAVLAVACTKPVPPASVASMASCGERGALSVELHGALQESVRWSPETLACQSMPRPGGDGARLRLSGPIGDGEESRTIAFILGIPDLTPGATGTELPTNVTLVEEGTGRFFSTQDSSGCWADIERHERLSKDNDYEYRIGGILYCLTPLAELHGTSGVTFTDMHFAGRINWKPPQ